MFHYLAVFAKDISFSHSIFALPFMLCGVLLSQVTTFHVSHLILLVFAMVFARTFAMGMNRYLDADMDKINDRTRNRGIPGGRISSSQTLIFSLTSAGLFVLVSFQFNHLTGFLAFPLLVVLASYSFLKRFFWGCHWYLGFCLGLAPIAAQIALTGQIQGPVILIALAVTFWTAGFDILYSIQDFAFDKKQNLYSIPVRFGYKKAVDISRVCFLMMVMLLGALGVVTNRGVFYYIALALVSVILVYEHWLVRDIKINGFSKKIDKAFFTANGWVSVLFYIFFQIDYLMGK